MTTSCLLDPEEYPSDQVLAARLGRAYPTYQGVLAGFRSAPPPACRRGVAALVVQEAA